MTLKLPPPGRHEGTSRHWVEEGPRRSPDWDRGPGSRQTNWDGKYTDRKGRVDGITNEGVPQNVLPRLEWAWRRLPRGSPMGGAEAPSGSRVSTRIKNKIKRSGLNQAK